jgi:hypothetical protein
MNMDSHNHSMTDLFDQLGLASTEQAVEEFIHKNSPLPADIELHEAGFWTESQSSFLKQSKDDDADWSRLVDQLDELLR